MSKEILTRCDYRCDLCLAYKDNIFKEDKRQVLSDGWKKYFGFRIEPVNIYCDGCLSDNCLTAKLMDSDCPIRPCVKSKGYENCSQCDDFMCDKFQQRLVTYEDIQSKHDKILRNDYKLFIKPYENGERIKELKESRGDFQRMLNSEIEPNVESMAIFIGNECSENWMGLVSYIDKHYKTIRNIVFGGKNYGWALKFKQNQSTTLFTLFPERKAFTVLIVLGKRELDVLEENKANLSVKTYELISNTHQYHDGKWIWYRVTDNIGAHELRILMSLKKKPAKKNDLAGDAN